MEQQHIAVELKNITKRLGKVVANDKVCPSVKKGEILSALGENGSGKTTLMNMLSGIYCPDDGQIFADGTEVTIASLKDSFALGIGTIHQHFKLVDMLTAAKNIILGSLGKEVSDMQSVSAKIQELVDQYEFELNSDEKIYNMSVSQKQTVEIIKALHRGANILILDEPTAVLMLQETEKLFVVLRNMRVDGRSIIIITHKFHEVPASLDRVSVLRKGQYTGTVNTCEATAESLTEMMMGKKVNLNIDRPESTNSMKWLETRGPGCMNKEGFVAFKDISFTANSGEILGIAGITGSGQKELLEAIAGLLSLYGGEVVYYPPEDREELLLKKSVADIRKLGVRLSFAPKDYLGMGLVDSMDMTDSMMSWDHSEGRSLLTDRKKPKQLAERIIEELEAVIPGVTTPVWRLSGGNAQKVLVGREISSNPTVLMTAYPVRGLDINLSYIIYGLLNEQKKQGVTVLCVGGDLDVLLELCDRVLVLCGGQVSGIVDSRIVTKEEVGLPMMKTGKEQEHE